MCAIVHTIERANASFGSPLAPSSSSLCANSHRDLAHARPLARALRAKSEPVVVVVVVVAVVVVAAVVVVVVVAAASASVRKSAKLAVSER